MKACKVKKIILVHDSPPHHVYTGWCDELFTAFCKPYSTAVRGL
jgi:hypothetical protein